MSEPLPVRHSNARFLTALFAIVGGIAVATQIAHFARLRSENLTYATAIAGPLLAGVLLRARAALRSLREACFLGALAIMTLAMVTFAFNAGFGGVLARRTPIVELLVLVAATGLGTTAGAYLARRADPLRAGFLSAMLLALLVGSGTTTLAQQIYVAVVGFRDGSIYSGLTVWLVASLAGGFFAQSIVPTRHRAACALGGVLLPLSQLVYFALTWGQLALDLEIAIFLGGTFIATWLGAALGWHAVGRHVRVQPDALAAAFE